MKQQWLTNLNRRIMASTEGLVPITRNFLASYYDKYPFASLSDDVSGLSSQIRSLSDDLLKLSPPSEGTILSLFWLPALHFLFRSILLCCEIV